MAAAAEAAAVGAAEEAEALRPAEEAEGLSREAQTNPRPVRPMRLRQRHLRQRPSRLLWRPWCRFSPSHPWCPSWWLSSLPSLELASSSRGQPLSSPLRLFLQRVLPLSWWLLPQV